MMQEMAASSVLVLLLFLFVFPTLKPSAALGTREGLHRLFFKQDEALFLTDSLPSPLSVHQCAFNVLVHLGLETYSGKQRHVMMENYTPRSYLLRQIFLFPFCITPTDWLDSHSGCFALTLLSVFTGRIYCQRNKIKHLDMDWEI